MLGGVALNLKHMSLDLTNAIYGVGNEVKTNQVTRLTYSFVVSLGCLTASVHWDKVVNSLIMLYMLSKTTS